MMSSVARQLIQILFIDSNEREQARGKVDKERSLLGLQLVFCQL